MKFYLKYGIIYIALVLGVNLALDFSWKTLLNFLIVAAIVCLPALVISVLVRFVPKSIYNPNNKLFNVRKKENKLYEKLKIRKWKEKVPEAGKLGGFEKDKLASPKDPEYLRKFLVESCIAEAIHSLSIWWGIFSLIFVNMCVPKAAVFSLGLPLVFFNVMVHIMPVMIQRYIRPKLMRALEHVVRMQQRAAAAASRQDATTESADLEPVKAD